MSLTVPRYCYSAIYNSGYKIFYNFIKSSTFEKRSIHVCKRKIILSNMHTDSDSCSESSRPVTPSEDDCCHNACDPCIFDVHRKLLEEYERRKKGNVKIQNRKNVLCSFLYKNFVVVDVKEACECYILLSLSYQGRLLAECIKAYKSLAISLLIVIDSDVCFLQKTSRGMIQAYRSTQGSMLCYIYRIQRNRSRQFLGRIIVLNF